MKKIIIIGASSGIGKALAKKYSDQGHTVGLAARRLPLLQEIQSQLSSESWLETIDVNKEDSSEKLLQLIKLMGGVDIIIINAGIGNLNGDLSWKMGKKIIDTNVSGFVNMATTSYEYFKKQKSGQIVGISSIAAILPMSIDPVYSASKAFVSNYLEGLRLYSEKQKDNISITDIRPGWVGTNLITNVREKFWIATTKKAAEQIYSAIEKKKPSAYITKRWAFAALLIKILPGRILRFLTKS